MADIAACADEDGAHDVFNVLFEGDGEVFGAGSRTAVGERFFVADWCEARGYVLYVREFGSE